MKVTSTKTIRFSKLDWGINAGETRELPEGKEAKEIILAHSAISENKMPVTKERTEKKEKED